jgi:hypothetical protein
MKFMKRWLFYLLYALPALWYSVHYNLWVRDLVIITVVCFFVVNFATYTLIHAWKTFHRVRAETSRTEGYINVGIFVLAAIGSTAAVLLVEPSLWIYLACYTIGVSFFRLAMEP